MSAWFFEALCSGVDGDVSIPRIVLVWWHLRSKMFSPPGLLCRVGSGGIGSPIGYNAVVEFLRPRPLLRVRFALPVKREGLTVRRVVSVHTKQKVRTTTKNKKQNSRCVLLLLIIIASSSGGIKTGQKRGLPPDDPIHGGADRSSVQH